MRHLSLPCVLGALARSMLTRPAIAALVLSWGDPLNDAPFDRFAGQLRGVQWETDSPLSDGGSHASAIMPVTCCAPNVTSAPLRAASVKTAMISFSKSWRVAPAASAAHSDAISRAQRYHHRWTRWRSMPSSLACASLCRLVGPCETFQLRPLPRRHHYRDRPVTFAM